MAPMKGSFVRKKRANISSLLADQDVASRCHGNVMEMTTALIIPMNLTVRLPCVVLPNFDAIVADSAFERCTGEVGVIVAIASWVGRKLYIFSQKNRTPSGE